MDRLKAKTYRDPSQKFKFLGIDIWVYILYKTLIDIFVYLHKDETWLLFTYCLPFTVKLAINTYIQYYMDIGIVKSRNN